MAPAANQSALAASASHEKHRTGLVAARRFRSST